MFKNKYLWYVLAASVGIAPCALAQSYPTKPVRFVIGPAPDLLPRLIAQRLSESWGQQVIVDQRPGAGGVIAGDLVSKATPDGYTWLMSTGSFYVLDALYPRLPYNMVRDLTPVTLMATLPFIAVVHPSLPAKSLADLVQLAKASPGKLNYGSAGSGTTTQLAAELFKLSAKVNIVHVPYKGVAAAVTDLLGGQVQLMFSIAQGAGAAYTKRQAARTGDYQPQALAGGARSADHCRSGICGNRHRRLERHPHAVQHAARAGGQGQCRRAAHHRSERDQRAHDRRRIRHRRYHSGAV